MAGELFQVATLLIVGSVPPLLLQHLPGLPITGRLAEPLRVEWRVEKTIGPSVDSGEVTIYNLDPASRKALSVAMALPVQPQVQLHVGWGALPELLFSGTLWKLVAERRTGTDVLTTLEIGDGAAAARDTPPAGGAAVGMAAHIVIVLLCGQMGLRIAPSTLATITAAAAALPVQSFQFSGESEPRIRLDEMMLSLGLSWGRVDGALVVYQAGLRNDVLPLILTPQTGLLSWEETGDGGVAFEALAQPRLAPGVQLTIQAPFQIAGASSPLALSVVGGGPLRVERIEFRGNNEGESLMSGVARRVAVL